jgi:hypothetical protein
VVIIRTTEAGQRIEIPVDLEDAISGKVVDPQLQPRDVVYVPKSMAKTVTYGTIDMLVRMVTLRGIF